MHKLIGKRSTPKKPQTQSVGTVRILRHPSSLIEQLAPNHSAPIVDVGGGESTLVDDLLACGYENITVLDISQTAIDANSKRLGDASEHVRWLVADITRVELEPSAYDVWHDRAVFHFLTTPGDRVAYVRQVAHAVKPEGHVIVITFGPEAPHEMQWPSRSPVRH